MTYIQYKHHKSNVWVREDLRGTHREHCLCWDCDSFHPDNEQENCPIASAVYELNNKHGVTTPVWECPVFIEKGGDA